MLEYALTSAHVRDVRSVRDTYLTSITTLMSDMYVPGVLIAICSSGKARSKKLAL